MSHFTQWQTRVVDPDYLMAACRDLGYQCDRGDLEIRGYQGARTAVEIRMRANASFDIGFRRQGDCYDMVADWWGISDIKKEALLCQLTQRYAYHATRAQLAQQGFDLTSETRESDGRLHLVLRRFG
jgi:Protein of unknown function (DUF1257)